MVRKFFALDADEGIFFSRQLEQIKAKTYDILYPELMARRLIPLDTSTDTGATTVTYRTWDHVGIAKLLHTYATDLNNVELTAKETTRKIYGEAISFGYSIQDIRSAIYGNVPLEQRKANAARKQMLFLEDSLAFDGDDTTDIEGFINNSNVNSVTPVDGASGFTDWARKTPDEILTDITNMITPIRVNSLGIESPQTLLLSEGPYAHIATTPRSSTSDTTILEFILKSNPFITEVIQLFKLQGAAPVSAAYDSEDAAILYDRNPEKLWLETPQDVEMFPIQEKGLMFEVPVHARTAGTIIAYPISISQLNGI
jgi:hypothetical protein